MPAVMAARDAFLMNPRRSVLSAEVSFPLLSSSAIVAFLERILDALVRLRSSVFDGPERNAIDSMGWMKLLGLSFGPSRRRGVATLVHEIIT